MREQNKKFKAEKNLAPYEIPTELRILPELPRIASGKVELRAVAALFEADPPPATTGTAAGQNQGARS